MVFGQLAYHIQINYVMIQKNIINSYYKFLVCWLLILTCDNRRKIQFRKKFPMILVTHTYKCCYKEKLLNRCKLLYIGWIINKVLLHSTGNYIQYPMINHNGKECFKKECAYLYICIYTLLQKLTLQVKYFFNSNKSCSLILPYPIWGLQYMIIATIK